MKKYLIFVLTLIIFLSGFISVGECREVVFVLNSSQSMNNSDPQHRVEESVAWCLSNLNENDAAGVISFNNNSSVLRPLSAVSDGTNKIFRLNYSGQADAGSAMLSAVDMLSSKFDTERNIIFITNGGISLDDPAQTLRSVEKFQDGLKQASWERISVYLLNLRYDGDLPNYKSYAGLAEEIPIPHTELMTTLRTIIYGDFHKPHLTLLTETVSQEKITAEIPLSSPSQKIKLLLVSSNPGNVRFENIDSSEILDGHFVKFFETNSPQTNNLELSLAYPQGTGLTLDAVAEVEGVLQTKVTSSFFSADTLEITPTYKNNPEEKIFANNFFDKNHVRVIVDGAEIKGIVENGVIQVQLPSNSGNISLQKVHFEDLGVKFNGETSATIGSPEHDYLAWIISAAAIAVILILLYFLRRKNNELTPPEEIPLPPVKKSEKKSEEKLAEKSEPTAAKKSPAKILPEKIVETPPPTPRDKKVSYDGKLLIYITKTPNEEDIEPREFNLFRSRSPIISLAEILSECGLAEDLQNFGGVSVSPSRRGIFLTNNSDCTILKRGSLLEKGKQIEIYYNDSISISSPDGSAEIILRYKSLKPN